MKGRNGLLIALSLLERSRSMLKEDQRDQLDRVTLKTVNENLFQALERIHANEIDDFILTSTIIGITNLLESLINDSNFVETDNTAKQLIIEKVSECIHRMYLVVGKYYTYNDFDYSPKMTRLLNNIVDYCAEHGYYCGHEI